MADPVKEIAKALVPQLYADVKGWAVSLGRHVKRFVRNTSLREFASPGDLLEALRSNVLADGTWVRLRAMPSAFGPFQRNLFLPPFVGFQTQLRLGPPIFSPDNPVLGLMAQATSHLRPVGMYPVVDQETVQGCLYPADTTAFGFVGIMPDVTTLVPYMPALFATRFSRFFGIASSITGIVRYLDAAMISEAGFAPEDHEVLRQAGQVWFFDATHDDAKCHPLNTEPAEVWGGLYAYGHLEIESGFLKLRSAVDALQQALVSSGLEPSISQNQVRRREVSLFAKGVRAQMDGQLPVYAVHMDAELGRGYADARRRFDVLVERILANFRDACAADGARLKNPHDVDFSYTDGTQAYTVLKSAAADTLHDPVLFAIRDWHRLRGT